MSPPRSLPRSAGSPSNQHEDLDEYGPRVSAFAGQLVKEIIDEQSATVREFVGGIIRDVFARYRPELQGELHTRIVQGGLQVTGRGVRLDVKNRETGVPVSVLDIPVSLTIKVDRARVSRFRTPR